jgi:hypothetical protein
MLLPKDGPMSSTSFPRLRRRRPAPLAKDGVRRSQDSGVRSSTADGLFSQACCLTLVQGLDVTETYARLGADTSVGASVGFDQLVRAAYDEHLCRPGRQLAGAVTLDGWTLVLEPNGYACSRRRLMSRVSVGIRTVTLFHTADDDELSVMTDGRRSHLLDLRAGCRDQAGRARLGELPGEDPTGDEATSANNPCDDSFWDAAGAALVERYSGVRLGPGLVHGLRYRTGSLELA